MLCLEPELLSLLCCCTCPPADGRPHGLGTREQAGSSYSHAGRGGKTGAPMRSRHHALNLLHTLK